MKLVFVSSTFKDMQFERDILQTYGIPMLNGRLQEYGEKAFFGDLRWGVNTTELDSDEGSRKVLKVCLDQIDNCKPYMIVLIGERYGWIPAQELIDEACVLKGIEKIKDISVTELEIDYGALLNPEYEGRILFYFRNLDKSGMTEQELRDYEAESEHHREKIEALKSRIREVYPDSIRYYDAFWDAENKKVAGLEDFLSMVEKDLGEVLLRDVMAENDLPWQERSLRTAHRFFEESNKSVVETENYDIAYEGSKTEDYATFLYISGKSGSGKSALLHSFYASDERNKLAFCYKLDKFSRSFFDFEKILIYYLRELLGEEQTEPDESELEVSLLDTLERLSEPVAVYVDNADDDFLSFLSVLEAECVKNERQPQNVIFTIAVNDELPFYPFFEISACVETEELSADDACAVLDGIIRSNHKEISDVVKQRILSKENSRSAAYLKNIVKRLMILDSEDFANIRAMGDGMDNINLYMQELVDNTSDSKYGILIELIEEAKDRINREFVETLINLFVYVPVGFTVDEIRNIFNVVGCPFNDLDFSLSVQLLEDIISFEPYNKYYKLKNRETEKELLNICTEWDIVPVIEYMLSDEELKPYAFKAAVYTCTPEYLGFILKLSEIDDISESIVYLIKKECYEKAVDIILTLTGYGDFKEVKLLPDIKSRLYSEQGKLLKFMQMLKGAIDESSSITDVQIDFYIELLFTLADYMLCYDAQYSYDLLCDAYGFMKSYKTEIDSAVVDRLYFLMLKVVNKVKSPELFDRLIVDADEYLGRFTYFDEAAEVLLGMKVYSEMSELVNIYSAELHDKYREKAEDLAIEADVSLCKGEELIYIAELLEDMYWVHYGKVLQPFNIEFLRAEVRYGIDHSSDSADNIIKAKRICYATKLLADDVNYWRSIISYLVTVYDEDEYNEDNCFEDDYEEYVEEYIRVTGLLNEAGMEVTDYVYILHSTLLFGYEDTYLRLLEAAENDGEIERIVLKMIRLFSIEGDYEKLRELQEEFLSIKHKYTGISYLAALFVEAYFDLFFENFEDEE